MDASEYKLYVCIGPLSILQCLSNLSERRLNKYYHFTISALAKSSAKVMCQFQQSSGKIYVTTAKKYEETKWETLTHLSSSSQQNKLLQSLHFQFSSNQFISVCNHSRVKRELSQYSARKWLNKRIKQIYTTFDFSGSLTPLCKSSMKHLTCQIETNRK